jgi:hypothetical protein
MHPLIAALIVAAFGVAFAGTIAYFVKINTKLTDQAIQIAELKTQVSPLWAQVQARISSDLHHPNPRYYEMDGLLEKLEALTINPAERARLKVLLLERSNDHHPDITEEQRKKAGLMAQIMDMVVLEAKGKDEDGDKGVRKEDSNVEKQKPQEISS